jgi:hypothetical protein
MLANTNAAYYWKKVDLISKNKMKMDVKGFDNAV